MYKHYLADVASGIEWARSIDAPALLDFVVEQKDNAYPMVPSGATLHEMIRRLLSSPT